MISRLTRLSKPELEFLIDNCNFSEEEILILKMTVTGHGEVQIADKLNVSVSGISKKKKKIVGKMNDFLEVVENMTTIYVDGKRVTKEELKQHEIKIESVKKILTDKLKS